MTRTMLVRLIIAVLLLALVLWGLASMARDGSLNRSTFPGITESLYGDPRLAAPGVPGSVDVPGVATRTLRPDTATRRLRHPTCPDH